MDDLSQLFQLLSEPVRLDLLGILHHGEQCVCKLYEALSLPQSTVSRHLALLRNAGLVAARRKGTWMHYRLAPELWKDSWRKVLPGILKESGARVKIGKGNSVCVVKPRAKRGLVASQSAMKRTHGSLSARSVKSR